MSHANFGACITVCTNHPKNSKYLLQCKRVTAQGQRYNMPHVFTLTKFVIVEKYGVSYIWRVMNKGRYIYIHDHEHVNIHTGGFRCRTSVLTCTC